MKADGIPFKKNLLYQKKISDRSKFKNSEKHNFKRVNSILNFNFSITRVLNLLNMKYLKLLYIGFVIRLP